MINLNWQQFSEEYSPIKNTFVKDAPCDGYLFEDRDTIKNVPSNTIWTLIDNNDGSEMFITNGLRIINSLGYLVTRKLWNENETIEVRLEEGYEVRD